MPAPASNIISRSPNDPTLDRSTLGPSQLSAGPPQAPLRSAPMDSADTSTLSMLGESPLDQQNGGGVSGQQSGGPGMALGAVSMMMQGSQLLQTVFPGAVPPEVQQYLDQLMQVIPQMIQQQQSSMMGMGGAGGGMPPGAPPAGMAPPPGGMQQPPPGPGGQPMPMPTAALGPASPQGLPQGSSQGLPQRPRPPM